MPKIEDYYTLKKERGWVHESKFFTWLKGKRVIIVGPAEYIAKSGMGEEIDKYDVIVRLNLASPVPEELKEHIGSRTDVLYHLMMRERHTRSHPKLFKKHSPEEVKAWKKDGIQWIVMKNNLDFLGHRKAEIRSFLNAIDNEHVRIPWTNVTSYTNRQIHQFTRTSPNMGTIAIVHMLKSELKSLHVVGCDYHKSGYYVGYGGFNEEQAKLGKGGGPTWGQTAFRFPKPVHKPAGQLAFLKRLLQRERRFTVDNVLSKILNERNWN